MPVDFLTSTQRQNYGRYPVSFSADELARNFHLDDDDREWIATKRRDSSRLGFALQLATVRLLGTFLEDPSAVPAAVVRTVAAQIEVVDLNCVAAYSRANNGGGIRQRFALVMATVSLSNKAFSFGLDVGFARCAGPGQTGPACCSIMQADG